MNVYKGLLKKPELDQTDARLKAGLYTDTRYGGYTPKAFPEMFISHYPNCCAIALLIGIGSNTSNRKDENPRVYLEDPVRQALLVYSIQQVLKYWEGIVLKKCGPYLLCAINEHQIKAGVGQILEEFFGFEQLENDFTNDRYKIIRETNDWDETKIVKGPRIKLYGLCFVEFCDFDL